MLYSDYKAQDLEPQILQYWKTKKIVDKLRVKNRRGPKFYFLDGPPYTSGKFHLGHAWNYALKDIALRYKRMQGFKVWDRNGFDVHGLPTEHKVMDKYNLKTKEDIQKFGVDKFVRECEKFCLEMAKVMTQDLVRMGVTLNVSAPYMALQTKFMEGEWALIKKAYEQDRLYYGEKVMTWCQHCETAIAKHECEYNIVKEPSIFVKFPIKHKKDEYLVVWTTTPWTIPFNLAVMAGPEIDYVKVEVEREKWIVAKTLAGMVVQAVAGKKMRVLEEFKGRDLEGLEYSHPLEKEIPRLAEIKKSRPQVHSVILSDKYVDTTAGTGLVHAAPGCGPEDQEACQPYDILPFNEINEQGYFGTTMGTFAGFRAKVDDAKFIAALEKAGVLVAQTEVEHDYPHCWRCHKPVVFRVTFQWFFKAEDLKEQILKGNKEVYWVPDTANNAYEAWIRNLKDNSISRQRYWGTPLPIWKCAECGEIKVIGSQAELKKLSGKAPKNLHVPWIDKITFSCKCSGKMKRLPDVIDVWVDAGTASWNCLENDPKKIKELFPADLILEAKEQTRLWFSMLSIVSYIYLGKNAFKNVYVYGMLNDIDGRKMSKSVGNIISPYELIDKHGVDVLRYYMCQNNAGQDINFSWEECVNKARNLQILWNVHKLLLNLAKEHQINPFKLKSERIHNILGIEEKYILSKLHSTIKVVTSLFESYQLDKTIAPLEELYLELSRTYIQMVRDKSSLGEEEEKEVCLYTIAKVLLETIKMFGLIAPFISEAIYLNLREEFNLKELSVSHTRWPKLDENLIDVSLEQEMKIVKEVIGATLHAREKVQLGLRWPIKEVIFESRNVAAIHAVEKLREIIQKQTNAKALTVLESLPGVKVKIKPDYSKIGPVYGELSPIVITKLTVNSPETILGHINRENKYSFKADGREFNVSREMLQIERDIPKQYKESETGFGLVYVNTERNWELESEGYAREVMRNLQQLRKEAGLEKTDEIVLFLKVSEFMKEKLEKFHKDITEKVGAEKMEISVLEPARKHKHSGEFKIKQEQFKAWFDSI